MKRKPQQPKKMKTKKHYSAETSQPGKTANTGRSVWTVIVDDAIRSAREEVSKAEVSEYCGSDEPVAPPPVREKQAA